jgi:hypothetical protein
MFMHLKRYGLVAAIAAVACVQQPQPPELEGGAPLSSSSAELEQSLPTNFDPDHIGR